MDNWILYVGFIAWAAAEARGVWERRAHRQQVERLERALIARSSVDFATGEKILAKPEDKTPPAPRKPGVWDQMMG